MRKTIKENRKVLRGYIRLIGRHEGVLQGSQARQYFIMMHNFLNLEERFYDQCTIANRNLNKHLNLISNIKYISSVIRTYQILSEKSHKVRYAIETIDNIEDVRVHLKKKGYRDIYTKLIL